MYEQHNLRTNIQEWKNRIFRATDSQVDHELKFYFKKLNETPIIKSILETAISKYNIQTGINKYYLNEKFRPVDFQDLEFENNEHLAGLVFSIITLFLEKDKSFMWMAQNFGNGRNYSDYTLNFLETYINPLTNFIHDKIDESSSVLYLLEKYKKRVEWFLHKELKQKYIDAPNRKYEDILEHDLRLYLFDQGIEYPFSNPQSSSGRVDLIGLLDTKDPLILEVKIYDSDRSYGKERIYSGFSQIVDYTNNYNKSIGYLTIYNFDSVELVFNTSSSSFPIKIEHNNKVYFIIIINMNFNIPASKKKKLKQIVINEDELIQNKE